MNAVVELQPLGRVERKKRDKADRITRVARRLFARQGFEATTMREIAVAADIGHGTLFLYAAKKEDILVMIFQDEVVQAVDAAIATIPRRPLLDQVLHVLGAITGHHERHRALARVFVKELPFVDDARHGVAVFMTNLLGHMTTLITAAQSAGEIAPTVPPLLLARNLFGLYFSHLQRWLGHEPCTPEQRDRELREILDLQLAGLRPKRRRHAGSARKES